MYRSLRADRILETADQLHRRVSERFPGSGLAALAAELRQVASEAVARGERIRRPNRLLRAGVFTVLAAAAVLFAAALREVRVKADLSDLPTLAQFLDSTMAVVVVGGAGVLFLVTFETRLKRGRALAAVHELRALAHIIDMHQLTKDPDRVLHGGPDTASSPKRVLSPFELSRYLDYCTEMLSLVGKVGALYVQVFPDRAALEAVDQVEGLTTGLAGKIAQKLNILDRHLDRHGGPNGSVPAVPPDGVAHRPSLVRPLP